MNSCLVVLLTFGFLSFTKGGSFQAEEGGLCMKDCTVW